MSKPFGLVCQHRFFTVVQPPAGSICRRDWPHLGVQLKDDRIVEFENAYRFAAQAWHGFRVVPDDGTPFAGRTYVVAGWCGIRVVDGPPTAADLLPGQSPRQLLRYNGKAAAPPADRAADSGEEGGDLRSPGTRIWGPLGSPEAALFGVTTDAEPRVYGSRAAARRRCVAVVWPDRRIVWVDVRRVTRAEDGRWRTRDPIPPRAPGS